MTTAEGQNVQEIVMLARLHPDRIAQYERIHAEQSDLQKAVTGRRGYRFIRMYRNGTDILLLAERDPAAARPETAEDAAATAEWHASLADCFAEPWRPLDRIFAFEATR